MISADAASYAIDGVIERSDPEDWGGEVTNDFIRIDVVAPGAITLETTGDAGLGLGLSCGLYATHRTDGDLRFDLVPLEFSMAGEILKQQGSVVAGSYFIVLTAGISEWDGRNIRDTSHADGGPGVGYGSYHLEIAGDFSVSAIYEGQLSNPPVPEPSAGLLGVAGACGALACRPRERVGSSLAPKRGGGRICG